MQLDGQRVAVERHADCKAAALRRVVKAAHVPADRHGLRRLQAHEPLDQVDGFLPVSERERILHHVERLFLPLARLLVLDVPRGGLVILRLADVVQQGADRVALLAVALCEVPLAQHLVDVDAVHHKPARAGTVELRARRRRVKIGRVEPGQQLLRAVPRDIGRVQRDEFIPVWVGHTIIPFHFQNKAGKAARRRFLQPTGSSPQPTKESIPHNLRFFKRFRKVSAKQKTGAAQERTAPICQTDGMTNEGRLA